MPFIDALEKLVDTYADEITQHGGVGYSNRIYIDGKCLDIRVYVDVSDNPDAGFAG